MARTYVVIAIVCFFGLASAQYNPSAAAMFYPIEHRSDLRVLQNRAANAYEIQVVPTSDQDDVEIVQQQSLVEYDPANVSLLGLVWDYLPSPILAIKSVVKLIVVKVWKLAKFLLPLNLVLLGMSLVVGFCAFTPYCTMVIEEPIASKIRAIRSSIPYIDELEFYVNEGISRVHELQLI